MTMLSPAPLHMLKQRLAALPVEELARLAGGGDPAAGLPEVDPVSPPLSAAQERLWFMDRLAPDSASYNLPFALGIRGPLDPAALEVAIGDVIARHEPLRTIFPRDSGFPHDSGRGACQRILPPAAFRLPVEDLTAAGTEAEACIRAAIAAEAATPFDLANGPVMRARLLRRGPDDHVLVYGFHHIAFDGWSIGIFNRDLATALDARSRGTAPAFTPVARYAAVAAAQALPDDRLDAETGWWRDRLSDLPPLSPRGDRPRPAEQSFAGAATGFRIPAALAAAADRFGRACGASLNMVLLAAVTAALGRIEGLDRFVIGASVAGRTRPEAEDLIGFFVNNLMIRADLAAAGDFAGQVAAMRDEVLQALDHQAVPFQKLVEALAPERDLDRNPLYQVAFTFQNAPLDRADDGPLRLTPLPVPAAATHMDLEILAWPEADGIWCHVIYSTDLFRETTVQRIGAAVTRLLEAGLADPAAPLARLPLADPAEAGAAATLDGGPALAGETTEDDLFARLDAALAARGDAPALTGADGTVSAAMLREDAARWEAALGRAGITAGEVVALMRDPGRDYLGALLGCLRAGVVAAPLDPRRPPLSVRDIAAETGIRAVVAPAAIAAELPGLIHLDPADLPPVRGGTPAAPHPDAPAVLIHTSGSTGRPKAVALARGALLNRLIWAITELPATPGDLACLKTSPAFVDSLAEVLHPLLGGFPALVPAPDEARDPAALCALIRRHGVTRLVITPSVLAAMIDADDVAGHGGAGHGAPPWPLRVLHVSGEPLDRPLLRRLHPKLADGTIILNLYGSSEVTADATVARIDPASDETDIPIGLPLPGCIARILDPEGQPVPPGMVGELHLSGRVLALGYHGDAARTAGVFRSGPGGMELATGDLVSRRPDGQLVHRGRRDLQIKIRGVRIEPGEIEARLADHPRVRDALVAAVEVRREADAGPAIPDLATPATPDRRLVAYVVPADKGGDPDTTGRAVDRWRQVYDDLYGAVRDAGTAVLDDYRIWESSYDGRPIPAADMEEWVAATVARIRALNPARVLEIGVGQGFLAARLAPDVPCYVGTDVSRPALDLLRGLAGSRPDLTHLRLIEAEAADPLPADAVPPGGFDVVVLNSVVQYLPSIAHLDRVLAALAPVLAPDARILLGDLRNLAGLPAFHADVLRHRAEDRLDGPALRDRVTARIAAEPELVLHPRAVPVLAGRHWPASAVATLPRRGRADNELTAHRYDAVIHLNAAATVAPEGGAIAWAGLDALETALVRGTGADRLIVTGIPHRRLAAGRIAHDLVDPTRDPASLPADAARWRQAVAAALGALPDADGGTDPETLHDLAARHGWRLDLQLDHGEGADGTRFTAMFRRAAGDGRRDDDLPPVAHAAIRPEASPALDGLASHPERLADAADLKLALRDHLARTLPPAMVPDVVVLLDAWPRTATGKIDRRRLPPPTARAHAATGRLVEAGSTTEKRLAAIWRAVLGLDEVGIDDNFFGLGGNSLLLAEVQARIARETGRDLPLVTLFRHPNIRALAAGLDRSEAGADAATGEAMARARARRAVRLRPTLRRGAPR